AGAWLGLTAREEKVVDDLVFVPPSARLIVSGRLADVWEGGLGQAARKALPKDAAELVAHLKQLIKAGPADLERATFFAAGPKGQTAHVLRFRQPYDARKFLAKALPGARKEKVGGEEAYVSGHLAAFVKVNVLLFGTKDAVKAGLDNDGKRSQT